MYYFSKIIISSKNKVSGSKQKKTSSKTTYFCKHKHQIMKYKFPLFFLSLLLMILMNQSVYASDTEKKEIKKAERKARDKYLGLGLGFSCVKLMDQATSPLLYKGFNFPFASLGYLTHSDKRIKTLETDFSYGNLKSDIETPWYDAPNTSYYLAIRYNILYRLRPIVNEKINWYLGPEFNINGHFRVNYKYGNSALTFDNYYGLGVATRFEYPFSWKSNSFKFLGINFNRRDRDLRLSWQVSTPVLSYLIRPTYVTITNFIDPDLRTKITDEQTTGGIFIPFNLRSQTELYYILHNQNMFKLSYVWNFYNHNPGYNKVQSAFHGIQFSFIFKFNNKTPEK